MREQDIICTTCPMGCSMHVVGEGDSVTSVTGNQCKLGIEYATNEFICPMRTLTTTVVVPNGVEPLLPVRTAGPVPKAKLFECMSIIRNTVFEAPIKEHQVLIENIADTGVNIVSCMDREVK